MWVKLWHIRVLDLPSSREAYDVWVEWTHLEYVFYTMPSVVALQASPISVDTVHPAQGLRELMLVVC